MLKTAIIDLQGGFGNQIFQFAFGCKLKELGYRVLFDKRKFSEVQKFPRKLEINPSNNNFKLVNTSKLKKFINLYSYNDDNYIQIQYENRKLFRVTGYFQDLDLIKNYENEITSLLSLETQKTIKEKALVHIRRGDYVQIGENIGNLYYKKAIRQLLKYKSNIKYDIFTDDISYEPDKKIFVNTEEILYPSNSKSTLESFLEMLNYRYYIISNSTFSALAAILSPVKNKVIIYPSPWFKHTTFQLKNVPTAWIKINR